MTQFRTLHNKNYTVINNTIVTDNRLSWKAKGIWLYAFSRPDDWTFYEKDIINQSTDGRDSVRAGLKELEECGYLVRNQKKVDGKFSEADWIFYEVPQELKKCLPQTENPSTENPSPENHLLLSTEEKPSTKEIIDDDDRVRGQDFPEKKEQPVIESEADIEFTKTNGLQDRISVSDVFRLLLPRNFATATIQEAIKRIRSATGFINDPIRYIESTCEGIENAAKNPKKPPAKSKNKPPKQNPFPVESNKGKTITVAEYLKQKGLKL